MKRFALIAIATLAMAACQSVSNDADVSEDAAAASSAPNVLASQPLGVPENGLPAQQLLPGECGLFLWTRRSEPEFVFFSKAGSEDAKLWFDETSLDVDRIGLGGDIFGQQLTEQTFQLPSGGKTLKVTLKPGEELVGGQRIPEASLNVSDADGWSTLIPAAGVTACIPEL